MTCVGTVIKVKVRHNTQIAAKMLGCGLDRSDRNKVITGVIATRWCALSGVSSVGTL